MTKGWSDKDLMVLKNRGFNVSGFDPAVNTQKSNLIPKPKPVGLNFIEGVLIIRGIPFRKEYQFSDKRKFRFDICLVEAKLGIEYEGLVSERSRHTTIAGFTGDCSKYNLAQLEGWKVLRYTAKNYKDFEQDIQKIDEIRQFFTI